MVTTLLQQGAQVWVRSLVRDLKILHALQYEQKKKSLKDKGEHYFWLPAPVCLQRNTVEKPGVWILVHTWGKYFMCKTELIINYLCRAAGRISINVPICHTLCGPWGQKHVSTSLELWSRERDKRWTMQLQYSVITANAGNQNSAWIWKPLLFKSWLFVCSQTVFLR